MSYLTMEQLEEQIDFDSLFAEIIAENGFSAAAGKNKNATVPGKPVIADEVIAPVIADTPEKEETLPGIIETTATEVASYDPGDIRAVDAVRRHAKTERLPRLRRAGAFVLKTVGASLIIFAAGNIRTEDSVTAPVKTAVAVQTATSTTEAAPTTAPYETTVAAPTTTVAEVATTTAAPTTRTVETTTIPETIPAATTIPVETTTVAATVPETTAPAPLPLTVQAENGRSLDTMKGLKISTLVLDKFCLPVEVYVENSLDMQDPRNWPYMTADALQKLADYNNPKSGFTNTKLLELEEDILMSGIKNGPDGTDGVGAGSPMYALKPVTETAPADCVPEMQDTRKDQPAAGSTMAVQNGGTADQYQAVADLVPEFAALPGGGKVTYIQGHRSTQSAAFNGLDKYVPGDTVTYTGDDGKSYTYEMVGTEQIKGDMNLDALVQQMGSEAAGQDIMVLQRCRANSNIRELYKFTLIKA